MKWDKLLSKATIVYEFLHFLHPICRLDDRFVFWPNSIFELAHQNSYFPVPYIEIWFWSCHGHAWLYPRKASRYVHTQFCDSGWISSNVHASIQRRRGRCVTGTALTCYHKTNSIHDYIFPWFDGWKTCDIKFPVFLDSHKQCCMKLSEITIFCSERFVP